MTLGFGNNTKSSLAMDISEKQTSIPVVPGTGKQFSRLLTRDVDGEHQPGKMYAKLTLTDSNQSVYEICHLVAVEQDTLTVIRAREGTEARAWALNDIVANFATRGSEENFAQIFHLQNGQYTAGDAGGTENALTLALPTTAFVNGGDDWSLRTPLVVYPAHDNTEACTLALSMGERVVGTFPLRKGDGSELGPGDIRTGIPLICLLNSEKDSFIVANSAGIYGEFYTKPEADERFQPKGNYAPAGESYTKQESDNRFQPKGNYAPAGEAYTKAQSDARYVQDEQLGAQSSIWTAPGSDTFIPSGCTQTGVHLSGDGSTGTHVEFLFYKPLQIYINGAWRTISG